jgi:DNA-binding LacI/PurR family transcriptional regulator
MTSSSGDGAAPGRRRLSQAQEKSAELTGMMEDETLTPTLRDIADAAGVSVASVSKVLNNRGGVSEESRRRILGFAEQLDYQGNRSARSLQRAGVDGAVLVIPAEYYSNSQFYEDLVRGILEEAAANSLKVGVRLVSHTDGRAVAELDEALGAHPGAVVAVGLDDAIVTERIIGYKVPAVLVNGMDRTMRLDCVLPDNWCAGWLATRRLLAAGHKRIMHVAKRHRLSMQHRFDGFRIALEEDGISFDPRAHIIDLFEMGLSIPNTQSAIRNALQEGRLNGVTALFCGTDVIALSVMQGLQSERLRVPEDVSIIGIDDVAIATHSRPPLTTIRIDRVELGRLGIQLLMRRIADPNAGVSRVNLGVKLIERATVAQRI